MTDFQLLNTIEVAQILKISRKAVNHLFDTGQLSYVVIGNHKRTTLMAIKTMLENKSKPQEKPKLKKKILRKPINTGSDFWNKITIN